MSFVPAKNQEDAPRKSYFIYGYKNGECTKYSTLEEALLYTNLVEKVEFESEEYTQYMNTLGLIKGRAMESWKQYLKLQIVSMHGYQFDYIFDFALSNTSTYDDVPKFIEDLLVLIYDSLGFHPPEE